MPPVAVLIEPPAFAEKEFTTQVERPAFGIGNGGPRRQPATVQSMPRSPPGLAASGQLLPAQLETRKRFVAPSGIGPSGTVDPPPPRSSVPQPRFRIGTLPAADMAPHGPLPA